MNYSCYLITFSQNNSPPAKSLEQEDHRTCPASLVEFCSSTEILPDVLLHEPLVLRCSLLTKMKSHLPLTANLSHGI